VRRVRVNRLPGDGWHHCREAKVTVALEYMPEAMTDLGQDPAVLLDWFAERNFIMYSLASKGDLTLGMGSDLAENGYVDLVFSRTELK
jgi:hypothetical protein